jgi:four helix bundle protein
MNTPAKSFRDLVVWQRAHALVLRVYELTRTFPREEIYGLTSQMRRAATSVPANIAEGFKKRGIADKTRYLNTSQGSLEELRYYLILAHDLHYASSLDLESDVESVSRLLIRYASAIERKHKLSP